MDRIKTLMIALLFLAGLATMQTVYAQETAEEEATEEGVDVREVMEEAIPLLRDQDFEGGLEILEAALKKDGKNAELLLTTANIYNQYGISMASEDRKAANKPLRRAAELMRQLHSEKEELSDQEQGMLATTVYNEACCAAIDDKADEAFEFLRESIKYGFDDIGQIKGDSDFESIKEDERFAKIIEELEAAKEGDKASRRPSDDV